MKSYIKTIRTSADSKPVIAGHVIAKGGVGKSTTTTFQAMRLAEQGKTVLIVDIDTQEDLSKFFIPPANWEQTKQQCLSSANLVVGKFRAKEINVSSSPYLENIDILPASETLLTERNTQIDRSGEGKTGEQRQEAVKSWITDTARDMRQYLLTLPYDCIFLHFSPATTLLQTMFIWCLDVAFIPMENDYREMDMVNKTLTRLRVSKRNFVPNAKAFVYLNKYEKPAVHRTSESVLEDSLKKIQSAYTSNLITPFMPLSQTIHKAALERRAPWHRPPTGQAAKVGRVVRELIDNMNSKIEKGE